MIFPPFVYHFFKNRVLVVVNHFSFVLKFNICFYADWFLHDTLYLENLGLVVNF